MNQITLEKLSTPFTPAHPSESLNLPNAAKLIGSLRHLDYDTISAICDIVDNSIDANASQVWVNIEQADEGIGKIEIIDDGIGMAEDILDQALKLGSETEKNPLCDLGLYGMGLITASISLGRRLTVITKTTATDIIRGIQDLDVIAERNNFVKSMEVVDKQEAKKVEEKIIKLEQKYKTAKDRNEQYEQFKSGTIVCIEKVDKCEWHRAKGLTEALARRMGQIFRKFIQAEKCVFYINGVPVKAHDPIYDYEPRILFEETISVDKSEINLVISEIKDYGSEINKTKGINLLNQGFYVLRNNREITAGETLGIFSRHNDYNLLRIEFAYPAVVDNILNTNFSKQKIKLNQSIRNKIERICNPFIRQVRSNAKQKQKDNRAKKEDFSEVEKYISKKAHLLKTPPVEIEKRGPKEKPSKKHDKTKEIHDPRLNITKRKRVDIESLKVKFETIQMGEKAPLFQPDQERDKVIVRWNVDHPFYLEVIAPNADTPEIFNPLAYLVYCYASAELMTRDNSDSQEIVDNIRWEVGKNLAVLMK